MKNSTMRFISSWFSLLYEGASLISSFELKEGRKEAERSIWLLAKEVMLAISDLQMTSEAHPLQKDARMGNTPLS